ncbi:MAG: hypothetical protein MMC23_004157 [Stictis urceolatum]|nr:hypothetical protein [Stictis urceolata]
MSSAPLSSAPPNASPNAPSNPSSGPPSSTSLPSASDLSTTITKLEQSTWEALKRHGSDLLPYLSADCTMHFPLGASLSTNLEPSISDVLAADAYVPWKHYEMLDVKVIPVGKEGAVISYKVTAWRGDEEMEALVGSTWRLEVGEWKLVFHQQTPF